MRTSIDLQHVEGPLALVSEEGRVRFCTESAKRLWRRLGVDLDEGRPLPPSLWAALEGAPLGDAIEWRPERVRAVLGCSRFRAGERYLVLMREVSDRHVAISRRLHRQRLELTGRLVASIAHELRNAVSSIVYSADLLRVRDKLPPEELDETVEEIMGAAYRMQLIVDGLLDYARLGPSVSVPVSLREVLTRAQGFLRSHYRDGAHALSVRLGPIATWVKGNTIVVEQIFVNLLLNAAEAATDPMTVEVNSRVEPMPGGDPGTEYVCVRVVDQGPGVPPDLRASIFEPFVTGRDAGTGLGLTNALEAVRALGGGLVLEDSEAGATFAVYLPRAEEPA